MWRYLSLSDAPKVLCWVLFLSVMSYSSGAPNAPSACRLRMIPCYEDYEYFQDGDIVLGGVFTVSCFIKCFVEDQIIRYVQCMLPQSLHYKNILSFISIIQSLNEPEFLPNITLGYHIYDSCSDGIKAVKSILQILSGPGHTVPNYCCRKKSNIAGIIGDHYSITTIPMAQILGMYRYTQISYGTTSFHLSDKNQYPTLFRTLQNDHLNYSTLSKLLRYFGWTWVGIIASKDDSGDEETQVLTKYMALDGICVAYIVKTEQLTKTNVAEKRNEHTIRKSRARVIVLCGSYSLYVVTALARLQEVLKDKTIIIGPTWAQNTFLFVEMPEIFNGSLTLTINSQNPPKIKNSFIRDLHPSNHPEDKLLEDIWLSYFRCLTQNPKKNNYYNTVWGFNLRNCSGKERLTDIVSFHYAGHYSQISHAVQAMAYALYYVYLSLNTEHENKMEIFKYRQLHHYLRDQKITDGKASHQLFDENGEFVTWYRIMNWKAFRNKTWRLEDVGYFDPWAPTGKKLFIDNKQIIWRNLNNQVPDSQCSDNCLPGNRKIHNSSIYTCCYGCVPCSEGEISNITDSENCLRCPDNEWPSQWKNECIPKLHDFLSYNNDGISMVLTSLSILFCLVTALILGIYVSYRATVIVKANNRNLSFVLLVSIMLSFLCVFLFLGRPVDITCVLRQTAFGVIFSIAVSSLLAKTIMVCIAFKATKPGSYWRKWIGVKLSNSIVLLCSSIQIMICVVWLAIAPPFQELDMHSYQGKIIVQCNEGSVIAFYCVLGYMGLLAAVSFIIAFLARALPDSFNEAKYITFSMLVFCSVWIAMIPAYLSTKGKAMVAVEIFAILASSFGLLGCIFFPKCYIILCRPELNTKTHLLANR